MKPTCVLVIFSAILYAAIAEHADHAGHGKRKGKFGEAKAACLQKEEFKTINTTALRTMVMEGKEIEDRTEKCFFKCLAEEWGTMNKETGEIEVPQPKLKNNESTGRTDWVKVLAECKILVERYGFADQCDKGYKYLTCIHKKKQPRGDYHHKHHH